MIVDSPIKAPAFKNDASALMEAHGQIRRCFIRLEVEMARITPNMISLAAARVRLSRAQRSRAEALNAVLARLAQAGGPALRHAERMQSDVRSFQLVASSHIARWNTLTIPSDWKGYLSASATLRASTQKQIASERQLLRSIDWIRLST
jgi:hypothetical protein